MAQINLKQISLLFRNKKRPAMGFFTSLFNVGGIGENSNSGIFSLNCLDLTIPDGKTMVILGPSGCGKTTLLKVIAGLLKPDSGSVLFDNIDITPLNPGERKIGMIFQDYAIYPVFTAKQNLLSYFLFKKRTPELSKQVQEKFERTSQILGIDIQVLMGKNPLTMSHGEKQRIALGRCITRDPCLFLMDEPFSSLDRKLREKYRMELKELLQEFRVTTVFVTHDHQEALYLADTLAIMREGVIEQVGRVEEIYNNPRNMFIADFLSFKTETQAINFFPGDILDKKYEQNIIGARPNHFEVSSERGRNSLEATIVTVSHVPIKEVSIIKADLQGYEVYIEVPIVKELSAKQKIYLQLKKYHIFDKNTEERINSVHVDA